MIYRATPEFPTFIERAGLRSIELAERAAVNRFYLNHIAAGRRNLSGALAARIATVYAATTGLSLETALDRLFIVVAEKKNTGPRKRGAGGRFVKADDPAESAPESSLAA
jgi:hypothetical protein